LLPPIYSDHSDGDDGIDDEYGIADDNGIDDDDVGTSFP
jgi:hypothetical protein